MFRLLVLSLIFSAGSAFATDGLQDIQRAADEKVQTLLNEIQRLKSGGDGLAALGFARPSDSSCDPKPTCVPHCTVRYSSGTCGNYGPDFCAPKAACVPNCTVRYSSGTCGNYGADFCGSEASCTMNCTVRYSSGVCGNYGPDMCF